MQHTAMLGKQTWTSIVAGLTQYFEWCVPTWNISKWYIESCIVFLYILRYSTYLFWFTIYWAFTRDPLPVCFYSNTWMCCKTEFGYSTDNLNVEHHNWNNWNKLFHNMEFWMEIMQVIESRDRSQDDPSGPATVQSCDAVRVSVLVWWMNFLLVSSLCDWISPLNFIVTSLRIFVGIQYHWSVVNIGGQ